MLSTYMQTRDRRVESRTLAGRFRGGKLAPVMAVPFRESEGGTIRQGINFELDPIPGRMLTEMRAHVVSVYVPALAIELQKNMTAGSYPGNAEAYRDRLLSGQPMFDLEPEGEISKRLGVTPKSVGGVKKVNEAARLAHNAAVNFLRRRLFVGAAQLPNTNTAVTPALLSSTVLDRLNGVLDPEDRVNGQVNFSAKVPVKGLGITGAAPPAATGVALQTTEGNTSTTFGNSWAIGPDTTAGVNLYIDAEPNAGGSQYPNGMNVYADFTGPEAGVTLQDFYTAELSDSLTRLMRKMVDDNPELGEDIVARFAHGLSIETGKQPFVLFEREVPVQNMVARGMDGASLDVLQTNAAAQVDFTVPVPKTEFGGIVITFAALKPDEALASQPHPVLSEPWGARNYVADQLALDPVPVYVRDLDADCAQVDEDTLALYVGNNHLLKSYTHYGFTRQLDPATVANKSAIWQLQVPMSVTPSSVIYPETLSHYPFADETAEVCQYTVMSQASIDTPIIFGPTPVEELAAIETENVFDDA